MGLRILRTKPEPCDQRVHFEHVVHEASRWSKATGEDPEARVAALIEKIEAMRLSLSTPERIESLTEAAQEGIKTSRAGATAALGGKVDIATLIELL